MFLATALLATACAPDTGTLVVQVRSDLVPDTELAAVRVVVTPSGGGDPIEVRRGVEESRSWGAGVRVTQLEDLAAGEYRLVVAALDRDGVVIVQRPVRAEIVSGVTVVTVLLTRDCAGVECPGSGADPSEVACLAGRCVQEGCTEETPEMCGTRECETPAECPMGPGGCVATECTATGACFEALDHESCSADEVCAASGMCADPGGSALFIEGSVFEDVNFGGGPGRGRSDSTTSAAASGFPETVPGTGGRLGLNDVRVELYDDSMRCVASMATNPRGLYRFDLGRAGTYIVRVVNETVGSVRPGPAVGVLAVQTYRTDGDADGDGTADEAPGSVGGAFPSMADSGPAACDAAGGDPYPDVVQSSSTFDVQTRGILGVRFGFNFDLVVNDNDAGQGSLRQFIINANQLDNDNLDQEDDPAGPLDFPKPAGSEYAIFQIPMEELQATIDGGAGTAIIIDLASPLPPITGAQTRIDGALQTDVSGDTNASATGATLGPEVILRMMPGAAEGVVLAAPFVTLANVGVTGAVDVSNPLVALRGAGLSRVEKCTIWGAPGPGMTIDDSVDATVESSLIRGSGRDAAGRSGIELVGIAVDVTLSLLEVTGNAAHGIAFIGAGCRDISVLDSTISGNGVGGTGAGLWLGEGTGHRIAMNTITMNAGDGIVVLANSRGNRLIRNLVAYNGDLGIDLSADSVAVDGDGSTLNDPADGDSGGNQLQNAPTLGSATVIAGETRVVVTFDGTPSSSVQAEIYSNAVCNGDTAGVPQTDRRGEAERFEGMVSIVDMDGDGVEAVPVMLPADLSGRTLTATFTDVASGDTSELSACVDVL